MDKRMVLKSAFFPFQVGKLNKKLFVSKNIKDFLLNYDKNKDFEILKEKILNKKNISRNKFNISNYQELAKPNINIISSKSQSNFFLSNKSNKSSYINDHKNKTVTPIINSYFYKSKNDNDSKRNYSAYYMKGDLRLKKIYISDLLIKNNKDTRNKAQKISDIEKKINNLEKTLNISNYNPNSKSKSFYLYNPSKKLFNMKKGKEMKKKLMPDYLKDEYKIKGTNVLSPFCKKWRERYMMDKFSKFLNKEDTMENNKKSLIDNKLNIIYAENQKMYQKKLKLINRRLVAQGKKERYKFFFSPSEKQLKDIERKVGFIKNVFYFAIPDSSVVKFSKKSKDSKKNKSKDFLKKSEKFEHINRTYDEHKKRNILEINFK